MAASDNRDDQTYVEKPPAFRVEALGSYDGDDVHFHTASSQADSKIWFKSIPITAELKDNITRLQLSTRSHDQGWVSDTKDGSWSWFEIAIMENEHSTKIKLNLDGYEMTWRSHSNRIGKGEYSQYFGFVFDQSSSLLQSLEVR